MASSKLSSEEEVAVYILKLEENLAVTVSYLIKIILKMDNEIATHIKWNSVSFYYTGSMKEFNPKEYKRDLLVLNIRRKNQILLVFPSGNRISDTSGFLEGNYADGRKLAKLKNLEDVKMKEGVLKAVILDWITKIEK